MFEQAVDLLQRYLRALQEFVTDNDVIFVDELLVLWQINSEYHDVLDLVELTVFSYVGNDLFP